MTKSELIEIIAAKQAQLSVKDVELAVKTLIEQMSETLAAGERIEIRGFGSFSLHYRAPRIGRNPKTGESVGLAGKYVPHFKPGKELRDRVNEGLLRDGAAGLTSAVLAPAAEAPAADAPSAAGITSEDGSPESGPRD
jgi:integration host factor subunit beta